MVIQLLESPSTILAEGLISKNSRDNKTAIELFVGGVRGLADGLWRLVCERPNRRARLRDVVKIAMPARQPRRFFSPRPS